MLEQMRHKLRKVNLGVRVVSRHSWETLVGNSNRSFMLTDVLVGNVSPIPEPGDKVWVSFSSPVAPRVLSLSGFSSGGSPCWTGRGVSVGGGSGIQCTYVHSGIFTSSSN